MLNQNVSKRVLNVFCILISLIGLYVLINGVYTIWYIAKI